MKFIDLYKLLHENMFSKAWISSVNEETKYTYCLRDNVSVSITQSPSVEDNTANNEFTSKFINKNASYLYYSLNYNGGIVKTYVVYMVDGGRAIIPAPRTLGSSYIEDDELVVAVIIDKLMFANRDVDTKEYLEESGLKYQPSVISSI